jgi:ring-1,2-phenylacetyl-CoA epoxidase subunit PaaC
LPPISKKSSRSGMRWCQDVLRRATLTIPESGHMMTGGRLGRHTEYLGHMLSEMQIVARSHPGAEW